jgi:hypothetical protein|nr:MAG TPA_asm: hypothetical protein [Caudoviricetes sp.]
MNPEELAKFQALFTMYKKQRRVIEAQNGRIKALEAENKALKEGLVADSAAFEAENAEIFEAVHRNHKERAPIAVTYYYGR